MGLAEGGDGECECRGRKASLKAVAAVFVVQGTVNHGVMMKNLPIGAAMQSAPWGRGAQGKLGLHGGKLFPCVEPLIPTRKHMCYNTKRNSYQRIIISLFLKWLGCK